MWPFRRRKSLVEPISPQVPLGVYLDVLRRLDRAENLTLLEIQHMLAIIAELKAGLEILNAKVDTILAAPAELSVLKAERDQAVAELTPIRDLMNSINAKIPQAA